VRLLRKKAKDGPNPDFDWREVVCSSENAAKAEAEKRQSTEDPNEVEWVFLHKESTGEWIARRTPRNVERPPRTIGDALLDVFSP
jgi:hypothetical protein